MERKTMGTFIATLRKANGMTQRELAEKLGVSDKTISHWERDESAPDLSIIPIIADIFSVSCDELLRGEKDNAPKEQPTAFSQKSEKQIKYIMERVLSKHKILAVIACAVSLLGLLLAVILTYVVAAYILPVITIAIFGLFSAVILAVSHSVFQNKLSQSDDFESEMLLSYKLKLNEITFVASFVIALINLYFVISLANVFGFSSLLCVAIAAVLVLAAFGLIGSNLKKQNKLPVKTRTEKQKKLLRLRVVSIVLLVVLVADGFVLQFALNNNFLMPQNPKAIYVQDIESFTELMQTEKDAPSYAAEMEPDYLDERPEKNEKGLYCIPFYDDDGKLTQSVEFDWKNKDIAYFEVNEDLDETGHGMSGISFWVYTYEAIHQYRRSGPIADLLGMMMYAYYPLVVIVLAAVYVALSSRIRNGKAKNHKKS